MCFVHMFFVPNWVVHVCCLLWERLEHQLLDRRYRKTLQPKLIYLPKYLLPIFTVEIARSLLPLKDDYSKLNLFTLKANWLDLFIASENTVAIVSNWLKMKVNAANMACYPYLCFFTLRCGWLCGFGTIWDAVQSVIQPRNSIIVWCHVIQSAVWMEM